MTVAASSGKALQAVKAYWPLAAMLLGLLVLEYLAPDILAQKYFNNVYLDDAADHTGFTLVFLGWWI